MRFTYLFFSLLLCLSSYAQPNPINRRAMAIAGLASGPVDIPSSIGLTISNRWMSTRFATNATGISTWIDETNGFYMTLAPDVGVGAASATTNSVQGVYLDSAHCFYATNILRNLNLVVFAIYDVPTQNSGANYNELLDPAGSAGSRGYYFNGTSLPLNIGLVESPETLYGKVPDHATNNIITFGKNTAYTNGVLVSSSLTMIDFSTTACVGAANARSVNFVMGGSGYSLLGFLKELIIFNQTSASASQISNLNYYASHYPYQ